MKKKLFSFLLSLCSFTAFAQQVVAVDGFNYYLDGNTGEAEVIGSISEPNVVVIPESISYDGKDYPVASLGNECFKDCKSLTSIKLSGSIKSLGDGCFYGCI